MPHFAMDRPYGHAHFVEQVLAAFPELREEFDEDPDLLHVQMGAFASRLQRAKGEGDWAAYERGIAVADELWRRPDDPLLNALNVSLLEHLDFDGPRGQEAWSRLSPELQRGWEEMQQYLDQLFRRAAVRRKPRRRS